MLFGFECAPPQGASFPLAMMKGGAIHHLCLTVLETFKAFNESLAGNQDALAQLLCCKRICSFQLHLGTLSAGEAWKTGWLSLQQALMLPWSEKALI